MMTDPLLTVIDASHWQGKIDWKQVAASGITCAMLKASEGAGRRPKRAQAAQGLIEAWFKENAAAAELNGIDVIPYHFLTRDPPDEQADHFAAVIGLMKRDCVAWDFEGPHRPEVYNLIKFVEAIEGITGRPALAYYGIRTNVRGLVRKPWWLPRYKNPDRGVWFDPMYTCLFHQYTAKGKIPGISGNVDRSAFFGTAEELKAWINDGTLP